MNRAGDMEAPKLWEKTLDWRTPAEALDDHLRSIQGTGVASTD
jgi:hypothetical protein